MENTNIQAPPLWCAFMEVRVCILPSPLSQLSVPLPPLPGPLRAQVGRERDTNESFLLAIAREDGSSLQGRTAVLNTIRYLCNLVNSRLVS